MERIELLRGANSGLYGQGNLGGIINAISKAPYPGQTNEVALQGGSFGRVQGMFDLGGDVVEADRARGGVLAPLDAVLQQALEAL